MAVYQRGNSWVADFYIGGRGGKRIRRTESTKELAEAIERDAKLKEFKGEVFETRIKRIRLSAHIEKYIDLHESGNRSTTNKRDNYVFSKIKAFFGDPLIYSITREGIETYKSHRRKYGANPIFS